MENLLFIGVLNLGSSVSYQVQSGVYMYDTQLNSVHYSYMNDADVTINAGEAETECR